MQDSRPLLLRTSTNPHTPPEQHGIQHSPRPHHGGAGSGPQSAIDSSAAYYNSNMHHVLELQCMLNYTVVLHLPPHVTARLIHEYGKNDDYTQKSS